MTRRLRYRAECHDCTWTSTWSITSHWPDHERHAHWAQYPAHDVHVTHRVVA